MSRVSDAEKPSSPWYRWFGEWLKDEKFWRDVGSRFLSGVLVVFVTWFAAVAFGYLQQPEFAHNLGNVMLVLAAIAIVLSVPLQVSHAAHLHKRGDEQWKIWAWSVAFDVLGLVAVIYFGVSTWEYSP